MQYLSYATESKYFTWSQILSHLYTYGFKVTAVYFCDHFIPCLQQMSEPKSSYNAHLTGYFLTTAVTSQKKKIKLKYRTFLELVIAEWSPCCLSSCFSSVLESRWV